MELDHESMKQAVVEGDVARARELAGAVVAAGGDALAAIERGFAPGIQHVGALWEEGEYFLPELVQGAEAMKAAMAALEPALRGRGAAVARGRVVIGTVQGDLHDIGKALVGTLLSAHGFEVHDLGSDVPVARFVAAARELGAGIVAASALLTTTCRPWGTPASSAGPTRSPSRPRASPTPAPTRCTSRR